MPVDSPSDHSSNDDAGEIKTPRFELTPYARSMSTGELRAAVAQEDAQSRECAVRMFKLFNADDHLFALDAAEELLANNPRHALANACALECRARIEADYALAPHAVPRIIATGAQIAEAHLDHREGFLLSLVDGVLPIEQLADVSGVTSFELVRGFGKLRRLGLVAVE
jgi:hypothetical protein